MILAALGVALLTAYYFGIQPAIWAGAATVALMLAALVPSLTLYAYVALAIGVGAIAFAGPRFKRPRGAADFVSLGRTMAKRAGDAMFGNKRNRL